MSVNQTAAVAEPMYKIEVVGPVPERCRDLVIVLSSLGFSARVHAMGLLKSLSLPDAYVLDIDGFETADWDAAERATVVSDLLELAVQGDVAVVGASAAFRSTTAKGFERVPSLIDLRRLDGIKAKLTSAIRLALLAAEIRLRRGSYAAAGLDPPVTEARKGHVLFAGLPTQNFLSLAAAFAKRGRQTVAALSPSSALNLLHEGDCSLVILGSFGAEEKAKNLINVIRHSPRLSHLPVVMDESSGMFDSDQTSIRSSDSPADVTVWLERLMLETEQQLALKSEASSCAIGSAGDVGTRLFSPHFALYHLQRQVERARETNRPLSVAVLFLTARNPATGQQQKASPAVFCQAAQLIRHLLRGSDLACRLDWQSLLITMPGETVAGGRTMATRVAEMLSVTAFSDQDDAAPQQIDMRASIVQLEPGLDAKTLVRLAASPFAASPVAA
jgi:PleD family two-component response regulator